MSIFAKDLTTFVTSLDKSCEFVGKLKSAKRHDVTVPFKVKFYSIEGEEGNGDGDGEEGEDEGE